MRDQHRDTTSLLRELRAMAALTPEEAPMMPPGLYCSEEILELEKENIFRKEWICAGRADEIPQPGDYLCFEVVGEPILIVRHHDGSIRALSNVCQHRWAILKSGRGSSSSFQCPYHAWTYDLGGQLLGAPFMDKTPGFHKHECRLPEFRVEIWAGFLYVNLDKDAAPLAPRLAGLNDLVEHYELGKMRTVLQFDEVWNCNWKVLMENTGESYHNLLVHAKTLGPFSPSEQTTMFRSPLAYNKHYVRVLDGFPVYEVERILRLNPKLTAEEAGRIWLIGIYPGQMLALIGDFIHWIGFQPISTTQSHFHYSVCQLEDIPPVGSPEHQALIEHYMASITAVNKEDHDIVSSVTRGVAARAAGRGRYSYLEHTLWEFARYLSSRLCSTEEASDAKA